MRCWKRPASIRGAGPEAIDRAAITSTRLLPQWGGGLVLLGYAVIFAAAGTLVTLRRDVT